MKRLLSVVLCLNIACLGGCVSSSQSFLLKRPESGFSIPFEARLPVDMELSSLIQTCDKRWDTFFLGVSSKGKYINLEQGNKMAELVKRDLICVLEDKGFGATHLKKRIGEGGKFQIAILDISMGQGRYAVNPSNKSLTKRRHLAGSNVVEDFLNGNYSGVRDKLTGADLDTGIQIILECRVFDRNGNKTSEKAVMGYDSAILTNHDELMNTGQALLNEAYKNAIANLAEMVITLQEI